MKTQNKVRMSLMAMGFAAALMFAGAARAQQEVDPTYFDSYSGAPAVQAASYTDAQDSQAAQAAPQQENMGESNLALALHRDATLEAGMVRVAVIDAGLAVILMGGIASLVAYTVWATKRERNSYPANELPYQPARS